MLKVFRFCPFCAEKLARKTVSGRKRRYCAACGFVDYENARPTAAAVIVNEQGEVLLARRAGEPFKGEWNLPGGFIEGNEHPAAGVVRELKEETGAEIELIEQIGIYLDSYNDPQQGFIYTFNIPYAARIKRGALQARDDTSELKWFPLGRLPKIAFECDRRAVVDWRRKLRQRKAASG